MKNSGKNNNNLLTKTADKISGLFSNNTITGTVSKKIFIWNSILGYDSIMIISDSLERARQKAIYSLVLTDKVIDAIVDTDPDEISEEDKLICLKSNIII